MNNITTEEKIKLLKKFLDNPNDQHKIDMLFDVYNGTYPKQQNKKTRTIINKSEKYIRKEFDKSSYKYVVFLKLLNKILSENDMNQITDIYDFKNITKEQMTKNIEANRLFNMEEELFKKKEGFNKITCNWYIRNNIDTYIISFIRGACIELGIHLDCTYKRKAVENKIVHYVLYSIY